MKRLLSNASRPLFHAIWLFTSFYCLLAYVPFTYRQVLGINLLPWLNSFARVEHWVVVALTALLSISILKLEKVRDLAPEDRRELYLLLSVSILLALYDLPARLTNDWTSLAWSLGALIPSYWLSWFDLRNAPPIFSRTKSSWTLVGSGLGSGLITAAAFGIAYHDLTPTALFTVLAFSVLAASLISLFQQIVERFQPQWGEVWGTYGIAGGISFALFLVGKVCGAIAFFGPLALVWSLSFGIGCGLALAGIKAVYSTKTETETRRGTFALGWLCWAGLFYVLVRVLPGMDWNGLGQQLGAFILWLAAFVLIQGLAIHSGSGLAGPSWKARGVIVLVALAGLTGFFTHFPAAQRLKSADPAFTLAKEVIFPSVKSTGIYAFLQKHTNLPESVPVQLKDMPIASRKSVQTPEEHPFVFVFVIDSLRRDHLQPYNSEAATPQIAKFAAESIVFKNAFTRYGATGLSEPSIWAGRMVPHKMYPHPFHPINQLQKLIEEEKYPAWISRDSILKEILPASENDQDLDAGVATQDLDFCTTTEEILKRSLLQPVFVYSQPQNVHVSVLARKRIPYSQAVEQVDRCFGTFIEELKTRGIYDKSVIVLTADHGDSLGEEGRYGHAYTIFPEVIRIPLIMHLPVSTAGRIDADVNSLTFSTDVTPTLEFIMGRRPVPGHWAEGRSLVYDKGASAPEALEKEHLILSSYGPVAGLLSEDGKSIYIADGVNFTDHLYRITEKGASSEGITPAVKIQNETAIQKKILELYRYYDIGI